MKRITLALLAGALTGCGFTNQEAIEYRQVTTPVTSKSVYRVPVDTVPIYNTAVVYDDKPTDVTTTDILYDD